MENSKNNVEKIFNLSLCLENIDPTVHCVGGLWLCSSLIVLRLACWNWSIDINRILRTFKCSWSFLTARMEPQLVIFKVLGAKKNHPSQII